MKEIIIKKWGVYDIIRKCLVYVYDDEIAAINQIQRGATNWLLVDVQCKFNPKKAIKVNCSCKCRP